MSTSVRRRTLESHARRQHGLFTLAQAREAGYSRSVIARRVASGEWEEIERRVFRSGPAGPPPWRQRLLARAFAWRGVASDASAGALYHLLPEADPLSIAVSRSSRTRSNAGARSTGALPARDLTTVDGIPCTTPARTVIDLGTCLPRDVFEDVLDLALVRHVVTPQRLAARAVELWSPRRSGCAAVLALLDVRSPEIVRARNLWEARVLRAFRALGIPDPRCNHPVFVGGRRRYIDFAWPDQMVAVEFDGFEPHAGSRRTFDDDRVRQNDLVDDAWRVYRLTSTALTTRPRVSLRPVARALGLDW